MPGWVSLPGFAVPQRQPRKAAPDSHPAVLGLLITCVVLLLLTVGMMGLWENRYQAFVKMMDSELLNKTDSPAWRP